MSSSAVPTSSKSQLSDRFPFAKISMTVLPCFLPVSVEGLGLSRVASAFVGGLKMPGVLPLVAAGFVLLVSAIIAAAIPASGQLAST